MTNKHGPEARGTGTMSVRQISSSMLLATLAEDPVMTDDVTAILHHSPACDVVLDFAGVGYVTSANLSLLLRLRQHLVEQDRTLTLRNIPPVVQNAFSITGLDHVFDVE